MTRSPSSRPPLSVWARLAAFLSFLAVLSALLAPASLLAEEVRTGKLGGLCSANMASTSQADGGAGELPPAGSHCDWCASMGLLPPPLSLAVIPSYLDQQVAALDVPANLAASIPGLPFSRGPPAL
ncbi:DUF2946 family protein [Polaromonas sp. OV174]|uniref:DUF2946 family protein n=1 Tax=Polaromonas sp. OV174 TaxID=1855300 RepID=UPI0011608F84|nr:DUF2946 family protein [Polaromonas sp. OV174]